MASAAPNRTVRRCQGIQLCRSHTMCVTPFFSSSPSTVSGLSATTVASFILSPPSRASDYHSIMETPRDERILFVFRHGETDWNREGRLQGHTDTPLNATGLAQAAALADSLRPHRLDAVVSSD